MAASDRMQRVTIWIADDQPPGGSARPSLHHAMAGFASPLSSDFVFACSLDISNILGQVELKPVDQLS